MTRTDPIPREPDSATERLRRHVAEVGGRVWLEQALEQARAEGRREAVHRIRAEMDDPANLITSFSAHVEGGYMKAVLKEPLDAILDQVAGLDASDSTDIPNHPTQPLRRGDTFTVGPAEPVERGEEES